MTNKKKFQLLTLALFAAMVVVLPLQAADGCQQKAGCEKQAQAAGCEKKVQEEGCMMLKQIPDLSAEQKAKLEKMHAEHQKMMAAAMAEMQKKCQAHREAVRALLSDAQKAKFDEMQCCGHMHGQGCMHMKGMDGKSCMHMKGKDGKGCMEKCQQEKHECQKKAAEEKK
jgi:phosphopantetheinyl transferase